MIETLQYTKFCEGIKSFVSRKRNENKKSKVTLIIFDGLGEEIKYDKEIPEYQIINEQLLNPDYMGFKILIGDLEVKKGTIKEPKKIEPPIQQTNIPYPQQNQAVENNAMNFLFSTMVKSNEILASSQKDNLSAMLHQIQVNQDAVYTRMLTEFQDFQKRSQETTNHLLEMEREKFKFEIEKREVLDSLGKDKVTITDVISKATAFLEKVPMPIWGGIYEKLTGREMPIGGTGEPSDIVDGILKEVGE